MGSNIRETSKSKKSRKSTATSCGQRPLLPEEKVEENNSMQLTTDQQSWLSRLESGILHEKSLAANIAYGHGAGTQNDRLSIECIMVIESTTQVISRP